MSGVFPNSGVAPDQTTNAQVIPPANIAPGCAVTYHSATRCQPRFDPAAANALISELMNVVICALTTYDCTRLDNLCTAIKALAKEEAEDVVFGCLERTFPDATDACSIEELVLSTDASGCRKIARYNAAAAGVGSGSIEAAYGTPASGQRPLDPNNPATFYNGQQLNADYIANTVNYSLLFNNRLLLGEFTLPCAGSVDFNFEYTVAFDPAANGGLGQQSRVVLVVDGVVVGDVNGVNSFFSTTNYESRASGIITRSFAAGPHEFYFAVIAEGAGRPPVPFIIFASGGFASGGVSVRKTKG